MCADATRVEAVKALLVDQRGALHVALVRSVAVADASGLIDSAEVQVVSNGSVYRALLQVGLHASPSVTLINALPPAIAPQAKT